jgi:hypothetical protein
VLYILLENFVTATIKKFFMGNQTHHEEKKNEKEVEEEKIIIYVEFPFENKERWDSILKLLENEITSFSELEVNLYLFRK